MTECTKRGARFLPKNKTHKDSLIGCDKYENQWCVLLTSTSSWIDNCQENNVDLSRKLILRSYNECTRSVIIQYVKYTCGSYSIDLKA